MKIKFNSRFKPIIFSLVVSVTFLAYSTANAAIVKNNSFQQAETSYNEYNGMVVDSKTNEPLVFASVSVVGSNISTVTNSEGSFSIKIPNDINNASLLITSLGYHQMVLLVSQMKKTDNVIKMEVAVIKLPEVVINTPKNALSLVKSVFANRKINNSNEHILMTAFYRETIKKGKKNASLAEAIVNVYKQPYSNLKNDKLELYKSRKSTDYSKLDTIALKLEGGPFNTLSLDRLKYPDFIFSEKDYASYRFTYEPSTTINNRAVYVVKFAQKDSIKEPLYYGKLFIDSKTNALASAIYNLNVSDKEATSKLFVRRKPKDVFAYPLSVSYRIDYLEKDGKWYYNYGNAQLTFKVVKKGKWFNSEYTINSEMAITNWKLDNQEEKPSAKDYISKSIIISDEASGFSDPDFWGEYNVIEPEKSIEAAIKKIKRKLD